MTRKEQINQEAAAFAVAEKGKHQWFNIGSLAKGFAEGAEWADEHPNDEVLKLRKMFESDPDAYKQGYKDAIEKACEWLKKSIILADTTIERFKKAMEEQQ